MLARPSRPYVLAVLGSLAAFASMSALGPHVALDVRWAYVLAFACVSAEIVWVSRVALTPRPWLLVLGVLATFGLLLSRRGADVTMHDAALVTFSLLVGTTLFGAGLGARIERPGHLLAVALISGVADLWSVYDPEGLSAQMAEQAMQAPDQLALFALPWPMLGTPHIEPIIGAGDILFTALYLATFERHGLPVRRAVIALAIAYAAGLVAILVTERPVPLLPLLGAGVLACDARARSLPANERRMVLVMLALLGGLLVMRFAR